MNSRILLLALASMVACGPVDEDQDGFHAGVDCDDHDNLTFPGGNEICDGIDNDCNQVVDDSYAAGGFLFYVDADGDGFGSASITSMSCTAPEGFVANASDCDDTSADVHPAADEYCNGIDNNCNGTLDDNAVDAPEWHADWDQDGYGSSSLVLRACDAPDGYIANSDDCNDFDRLTNPSADEVCDRVDNNCDGTVDEDEALDAREWYRDADGDDYGLTDTTRMACWLEPGWAAVGEDCNDDDARQNPGMEEICRDGVDNNCNDSADQCSIESWEGVANATMSWKGVNSSDYLGYDTAVVGDIDGDGFEDIVSGAYYYDAGGTYSTGAAFIFYGEDGYNVGENREAVDEARLVTSGSYYYAGRDLHAAGDVNNDGYADFVVAAYGANSYRGHVYLIYGDATRFTGESQLADSGAYWEGPSSSYYLGYSSGNAGDMDGDGYDDFLMGAYKEGSYAGAVFLVHGQADKYDSNYGAYDADAYWVGPNSSAYLGYVASLGDGGDYDGDGYDDVLMGAYRASTAGGSYTGASWVVWGDAVRPSGSYSTNDLTTEIYATSSYDYLGSGQGSVGDVNDDGYDDMGIGCYGCNGYDGTLDIFFGSSTRPGEVASSASDVRILGLSSGYVGYSAPASGDFNGDGISDIAIGAHYSDPTGSSSGSVHILAGSSALSGEYDANDGELDVVVAGAGNYMYLGGYGVGAGDFNGDGYDDLAAGGYGSDSYAGRVFYFEGTSL